MTRRKVSKWEKGQIRREVKILMRYPDYHRTCGKGYSSDFPYNVLKMAKKLGKPYNLVHEALIYILEENVKKERVKKLMEDTSYHHPWESYHYKEYFPYNVAQIAKEVELPVPTVRNTILEELGKGNQGEIEVDVLAERIANFKAYKEKQKKIRNLRAKLKLRQGEIETILELSELSIYWSIAPNGERSKDLPNYVGIAMATSKAAGKTITEKQVKGVLDNSSSLEYLLE